MPKWNIRTVVEISEGRYGLRHLPNEVQLWIWTEATKAAGWTNCKEKGDGSTMMMEWTTYAITKQCWLDEIHRHLGKELPEQLQDMLLKI